MFQFANTTGERGRGILLLGVTKAGREWDSTGSSAAASSSEWILAASRLFGLVLGFNESLIRPAHEIFLGDTRKDGKDDSEVYDGE